MTTLKDAQHRFVNRIRILYNIDRDRLPELSVSEWVKFRERPADFLIRADDETAEVIFRELLIREGCCG